MTLKDYSTLLYSFLYSPPPPPSLSPFVFVREHSPYNISMANVSRSGMCANGDCRAIFLELQRKRMHRYAIFKIDEKRKEVVVEKIGRSTESYADFTAALPSNDCRYAVFDFDFVTPEKCRKSKIFFITWSPENCKIRTKFLYATSKGKFRQEMDGIHYEFQANDPSEIDIQAIRKRVY